MAGGLYRLEGRIQHYAWGGHEFIPALLGFPPTPETPYAEYWLGAHERAPAMILEEAGGGGDSSRSFRAWGRASAYADAPVPARAGGRSANGPPGAVSTAIFEEDRPTPLDRRIADRPEETLGAEVAARYGRLPYLLKVLDVARPLSIQVHPTRAQAEAGFARENRRGIPLDSPRRNYKDRNHKPELMVALSDFWLLHGFLPEEQLRRVLESIPEFRELRGDLAQGGLPALYRRVMLMPPAEVEAILGPLTARLRRSGAQDRSSPDYWLLRIAAERPSDRGLFSLYFLNLVHLRPGQGIFQAAGIPHAYLRGQNVEVMANSDNVLRGGLTDKHVDVEELLRIVRFEGIRPRIIEPVAEDGPEAVYPTPASDFALHRISLEAGAVAERHSRSLEILLVMEGGAVMSSGPRRLVLHRGQSVVALAATNYRIEAVGAKAEIFRVSLP